MKGVKPEVSPPEFRFGSVPLKVDQRIEFLDRGQTPVAIPAEFGGVEHGGAPPGLGPGQLVAAGEGRVAVGIRAALPGQAGVVIVNRQSILG